MPPCKEAARHLPPGPWPVRKFALDEKLVVAFLTGDTGLVVQHVELPPDAQVVGAKPNGTDTEVFIQSSSYEVRTCQCDIPTIRVNFFLPAPPAPAVEVEE